MKKIFLPLFACILTIASVAQNKTYDLINYAVPKNVTGKTWKLETTTNSTAYTAINEAAGTWCRIWIVKSTESKGNIHLDFENEWKDLVVKNYKPTELPELDEVKETNGWKIKAGTAKFEFNNSPAVVMLNTATGFDRCISVIITTNSDTYLNDITGFLNSVVLQKPKSTSNNVKTQTVQTSPTNAKFDGFKFNTSNFDDGWTSTVQEDWVEVRKGNIKVLLHYPKEGTVFAADPEPLTNAAWNILVAPRYSNLRNYRTAYITTYNRPYLGMGYAKENSSGKEVFIVLFRQLNCWIEFVTPDKNTFIQQFKLDPETIRWDSNSDLMNPLNNMTTYNRFAVAASDLKGKWTSDFTGIQQMYNVYTGSYAGMNMNQSSILLDFRSGNSYYWKLLAVNGMVGNLKFAQVESTGTFSVPNNWQVRFSKIENRPKLYHAFWSCIKGARILNLLDADSPGSGIYTQYGLAK